MHDPLPPDVAAAVRLSGEAGTCFAAFDWASHPLGPVAGWPGPMRTMVAVALASRFPIVLWLGDELTMVYNDGYIPMLADKHPWAMGTPGLEVWSEIRDVIEPMLAGVVRDGTATWSDDLLLYLVDRDRPWEKYFTFTYSPIFGEPGSVCGVFCAVAETTARVLGERRLRTLNALGSALMEAHSVKDTVAATVAVCGDHAADLPFVAVYVQDPETGESALSGASPAVVDMLGATAPSISFWLDGGGTGTDRLVDDLGDRLTLLPPSGGADSPEQALVLPLTSGASGAPVGSLVVGLNPRVPVDERYRGFCRLLADQLAAGIVNARAYEAERRRADALAELDRAKTVFLTNVSHEFRTPLTLMLGPLEDALAAAAGDPELTERLGTVHRSGRRLLRLVNTLLDFARIEAGRAKAQRVHVDLGSLTADIASSFSDVCRRAGLELQIDCPPAGAAVDVEMWETVVLNLLSNAFKFTLAGSISVRLRPHGDDRLRLEVRDTGTGIAASDLPHVFDRFYRPFGGQGRSVEGSGVGLAIVRDLVALHGGSVEAESTPGAGTAVTVEIPAERELPPAPPARPGGARHDNVYVTEAAQWLVPPAGAASLEAPATPPDPELPDRPLVLVADDNVDLRAHLQRLLGRRWRTVAAADGEQALALARRLEPTLVVADAMMPRLDGFELVAALREDPRLESVPVIMLSARAGAEAAGEGFAAGIDDYLVKPFSAEDLVSRVAARLGVAERERARREEEALTARRAAALAALGTALSGVRTRQEIVEAVLRAPLEGVEPGAVGLGVLDGRDGLLHMTYAGRLHAELVDRYHVLSLEAPVPIAGACRDGKPIVLEDTFDADPRYRHVVADAAPSVRAAVAHPLRGADGAPLGALSLMWAAPRPFAPAELATLEQAAVVTARALERVKVGEQERQVAAALQERLLDWDNSSPSAAIATLYEPAGDAMRVGGDWYTISRLGSSGRIGISVGDVVGHGLQAATVMSELRSGLGLAALVSEDPGRVVELLAQYAGRVPGASCSTVTYAVVDPLTRRLGYASAGHPYPLVVPPSGEARFLEYGRCPPLGALSPGGRIAAGHEQLPPGSLLVLYTDGLVERRGESIDVGLERLRTVAERCVALPVGAACGLLLRDLQPPHGFRDDVVVVALRLTGSDERSFVEVVPARPDHVPAIRQRLREWLGDLGVEAPLANDFLLVVGEALINALEHGSGFDPEKTVSLEAFFDGSLLSATVSDRGEWSGDSAASKRDAARGRGLKIIHGLSDQVAIERSRAGTRLTVGRNVRPAGAS